MPVENPESMSLRDRVRAKAWAALKKDKHDIRAWKALTRIPSRMGPIKDQFSSLKVTRQRRYTLRSHARGLCWNCGRLPETKLDPKTGKQRVMSRCAGCLERDRQAQQKRRDKLRAEAAHRQDLSPGPADQLH